MCSAIVLGTDMEQLWKSSPGTVTLSPQCHAAKKASKGQVLVARTSAPWKMKQAQKTGVVGNKLAPEATVDAQIVVGSAGSGSSSYFQLYQSLFNQFVGNLLNEFWDCKKTQMPTMEQGHLQDVNLSDDQIFRLIHLQKFVPQEVWDSECTQVWIAQTIADFLAATQAHKSNCIQYALPGGNLYEKATSYEHGISPFQADRVQLFRISLVAYAHGAFKLVLPMCVSSKMEFYFGSTVLING